MTELKTPEGTIYADFVEYVRSPETFADKEYKKWLEERDAKNLKGEISHVDFGQIRRSYQS